MDNGYVKLHRKCIKWGWFDTPFMFRLFFYLIAKSNYKDTEYRGMRIARGQCVIGRLALSKQTGISQQSIRTCLTRLEQTGEITRKTTNRFTLITICNYDQYQDVENKANQQSTNNQPTTNQQLTTSKEGKEVKKKDIVELKSKNSTTKKNGYPYKKIIDFLNEKIGGDFKPTTETTKRHIKARFNEGFKLDDFENVITHKVNEWSTDPEMNQYLRPQTLFGTKFESYLVDSRKTATPKGRISEWK